VSCRRNATAAARLLLSGPAAFSAGLLTTSRSAIAAEAIQPYTINEAHQQGATSVLAWITQDDLGGAVVLFTILSITSALIFAIADAALISPPGKPPGPLPAAGHPEPDNAS
jgi:hypothetical protein